MLNLYRISQDTNVDWDTYDSAVVVAESEEVARMIHLADRPGQIMDNDYIDLLMDSASGIGFIRVVRAGRLYNDISSEKEEDALTEFNDVEPFIDLVRSTAKKYNIFLVKDGSLYAHQTARTDEIFEINTWEKAFREAWNDTSYAGAF